MRPRQTLPLLDAEASARLIGASSADEFAAALLEIARSIADVEELFGYMVVDEQEPRVLISQPAARCRAAGGYVCPPLLPS